MPSRNKTRTRRKFLTAVGAAGATGLAGCSGDSNGDGTTTGGSDGGTTVQIAGSTDGKNNVDAINAKLHEAGLPEDISVEYIVTSEISDDIQGQYRQWLSAGRDQPDIFRMDSGWTIPFIERGQLVNLSDKLSDDTLSHIQENNFEAAVNSASGSDGNLYGVPYFTDLPTIQYRKDLVEDAGFDTEGWDTEPPSWKRFSEIIAETKAQSGVQYGYAWQGNDYEGLSCCTFNELMTTWGGAYFGDHENLFGPVGDRPITVDHESVINAIRMGRTFIHGSEDEHALDGYKQISPDATLSWTEGPSNSAFMEGNAVALRYWPGAIFDGSKTFGDDLGVMPIPSAVPESEAAFEGAGGSAAALGGWHFTVNPNSANVDAAVKVLEAVATPEFRQFEFTELGYLPPDKTVLQSEESKQVEHWGDHIDTLRVAGENAVPRPVTVLWPDESPAISGKVNSALAQQSTPEQAMADLKEQLQQIENSA